MIKSTSVGEKDYYKIKDVADFIGEPQTVLRFWEQEFSEIQPVRGENGLRYYTPADVETLRLIHYLLRVRGMKIEAARLQLRRNRKNVANRLKILDQLTAIRSELKVMLDTLKKRR